MENKIIMLGMTIVFNFIFNANAQHGNHHQKQNVQHNQYNNDSHHRHHHHQIKYHNHNKRNTYYAPRCNARPIANIRVTRNQYQRRFWIEGFHSYTPHHGYVWNDGYYTSVNRGRVWIPTKFIQVGHHHRFQKIPGHYIFI